jgi:hypothetical protein
MLLVTAGLVLAALAGILVWRAADRFWHILAILALGLAFFPLVARWLTGDVSGFLPVGTFAEGADGKDQIVLASAVATVFVGIMLAACLWSAVAAMWRRVRP